MSAKLKLTVFLRYRFLVFFLDMGLEGRPSVVFGFTSLVGAPDFCVLVTADMDKGAILQIDEAGFRVVFEPMFPVGHAGALGVLGAGHGSG